MSRRLRGDLGAQPTPARRPAYGLCGQRCAPTPLLRSASVTATTPETAAYRLTDEQVMLRAAVRELADEQIAPRAAAIDRDAEFPHDVKDLLAAHDILGLPFPEEYGGVGVDLL